GVPVRVYRAGSMFCLYFSDHDVDDYSAAVRCDKRAFVNYFWKMLERGIYTAPSPFEAGFLSTAHSSEDIEKTLDAARHALRQIG
ncbi:aspartate aminotransferase family protein, partial [Candidatus Sumerlaeota bacterium]|nr:aspartate aminotransferase family protein [Candidatus Sumerlaeota bacterium]